MLDGMRDTRRIVSNVRMSVRHRSSYIKAELKAKAVALYCIGPERERCSESPHLPSLRLREGSTYCDARMARPQHLPSCTKLGQTLGSGPVEPIAAAPAGLWELMPRRAWVCLGASPVYFRTYRAGSQSERAATIATYESLNAAAAVGNGREAPTRNICLQEVGVLLIL